MNDYYNNAQINTQDTTGNASKGVRINNVKKCIAPIPLGVPV